MSESTNDTTTIEVTKEQRDWIADKRPSEYRPLRHGLQRVIDEYDGKRPPQGERVDSDDGEQMRKVIELLEQLPEKTANSIEQKQN